MAVNPEATWISTFASAMGPVADTSWAAALAAWAGTEADLMELTSITGATFTFNLAVFTAQLLSLVSPNPAQTPALLTFATAWEAAVLASTMVVAGGSGFGFSAIVGTGVASNSSAAKLILAAALVGPPTDDITASAFPPAFRTGFLALVYLVTGSGVPPTAPFPPIAPFVGSSGTQ